MKKNKRQRTEKKDMAPEDITRKDIVEHIEQVLEKNEKDYMTPLQIGNSLPKTVRDFLKFGSKAKASDVASRLAPFLGDRLKKYKGPRSVYIGFDSTPEEIVHKKILERPGVSSKSLAASLPMVKKEYLEAINSLIARGKVACVIKQDHCPRFDAATSAGPESVAPQTCAMDDRAVFKKAFDEAAEGGNFVRIHRIRERLGWSRQRFDNMLNRLRADFSIQLHGGDPSVLSEQQIADSFTDEKGRLRITATWRGADEQG